MPSIQIRLCIESFRFEQDQEENFTFPSTVPLWGRYVGSYVISQLNVRPVASSSMLRSAIFERELGFSLSYWYFAKDAGLSSRVSVCLPTTVPLLLPYLMQEVTGVVRQPFRSVR